MSSDSGKKPIFVVIEGIDRCGKNLQADYLERKFAEVGIPARKYSTPDYNGASGEAISSYLQGRTFLSSRQSREPSRDGPMALQSMLICNRYAVAAAIRSGLSLGHSAVCVRWWQSALLYGQRDGINTLFVMEACSHLPEPDLHLLLDVDSDRVSERLDRSSHYEDPTTQRTLAIAYRALWHAHYGKDPSWVIVEGDGSPADVAARIWGTIHTLRPDSIP